MGRELLGEFAYESSLENGEAETSGAYVFIKATA
jgi:hypothetical protein